MSKTSLLIISLVIIAVLAVGYLLTINQSDTPNLVFWGSHLQDQAISNTNQPETSISNFDECLEAGNTILESYPRQCQTDDGKTFIEEIGNELQKLDFIKIDNPRPNQQISSPLNITGEAVGLWYFEGDFSVRLEDGNGATLVQAIALAQGEWMTEDFVPFMADIEFDQPETDTGILYLEKANPSGLPENDDKLIVPVKF